MSMLINALTGANAAQAGLDATSQNTANLQTPGYSRQGVELAAVQPLYNGANSAGSGVAVVSVQRFSDGYTNAQLWSAASTVGQTTSGQPYLTQLEQVMGDGTTGIGKGLAGFASALNAASVDPASDPLRQQVISSATSLAQQFNTQNTLMSSQLTAVDQQRSAIVSQVNVLTTDIATLNGQIVSAHGGSVNASGLQDQRDQDIGSLASLVAVQVLPQADGSTTVSLASGPPLVVGTIPATMSATPSANGDGTQTLSLSFAKSSFTLDTTGNGAQLGGQLGGLQTFQDGTLLPMQATINSMASQLASTYNNQLALGYTPGTAATATTAAVPGTHPTTNLFQYSSTNNTNTFVLSVPSTFQTSDLAFASPTSNGTDPGDSGNLTTLIGLSSEKLNPSTDATTNLPNGLVVGPVALSDAMTQVVGILGTQSQENQNAATTAQTVSDQATATWQSVSGVSSNEEAANLIQYQQMYQANMSVIQVANTLFANTLAMFTPTVG